MKKDKKSTVLVDLFGVRDQVVEY